MSKEEVVELLEGILEQIGNHIKEMDRKDEEMQVRRVR